MMDPAVKRVAGFQPVMPSYLGVLSGPDAAAIVEYIRSLGGAP
jgi:cytochrome c oxidase subunit 2